jgi:hypothetical protein
VPSAELGDVLTRLHTVPSIDEVLVLSTCKGRSPGARAMVSETGMRRVIRGSTQLTRKERFMSYGHAERNLALIRQLEAETRQLFGGLAPSEPEQPPEPASPGSWAAAAGAG